MMHRAAIVILSCLASAHVWSEELPSCSEGEVQYSAPTLIPLGNHVLVRPLPIRPDRVWKESDPQYEPYSPQRTVAFNRVRVADATKGGPYKNSIDIFTVKGRPRAWNIGFNDLIQDVEMRWLNEDLLFMRAWWGRIVSTDLIFEAHSGTFFYAQEANYGALGVPCK